MPLGDGALPCSPGRDRGARDREIICNHLLCDAKGMEQGTELANVEVFHVSPFRIQYGLFHVSLQQNRLLVPPTGTRSLCVPGDREHGRLDGLSLAPLSLLSGFTGEAASLPEGQQRLSCALVVMTPRAQLS
jgi:hypothetical protein